MEIHGNDATIIEIEGGKEAEPVLPEFFQFNYMRMINKMILAVDIRYTYFTLVIFQILQMYSMKEM